MWFCSNKNFFVFFVGSIKIGNLLFDPVKVKRYMLNIPQIIPSKEMIEGMNNLTYTLKTVSKYCTVQWGIMIGLKLGDTGLALPFANL